MHNHHPTSPEDTAAQPDQSPPAATPSKKDHVKSVASTVLVFVAAPLIAIVLTLFVFQSYEVEGQSMIQTLQDHDRLIVLKLPRTWARLTHHAYIPKRGDIIVFTKKDLYGVGSGQQKQLIKRVIGLPGDRVVVKNNSVTIYNTQHPNGFNPDDATPKTANNHETLGDVNLKVPAGDVFVMGDNRPNSEDSRYFGPVSAQDIVGKLVLRIFPINQAQSF